MKINKLFGLTMAVVAGVCLFCSSCTQDDPIVSIVGEKEEIPADYVKMVFTIKDATSPQTYTDDSSFGSDLMVLILLKNLKSVQDDVWYYDRARKMMPVVDGEAGDYSVLLPSTLADKEFLMFVCGNATTILGTNPDDILTKTEDNLDHKIGLSEEEIVNKLTFDVNSWRQKESLLPMWGRVIEKFTIAELGQKIKLKPVKLLRAMTRIDVGLNYSNPGELTSLPTGLTNFKITAVHVERTLNKGQFIPSDENYAYDDSKANPYTLTNPSIPTGVGVIPSFKVDASSDGISVIQKIFIPEQKNDSKVEFAVRPCLIVEGDYTAKEGSKAVSGFYRLDIKNVDSYKDILRGNLMRMNITAVNGPGFKTKEEALKSLPVNVVVTLTSYNLLLDNMLIDGQYYLSAAKKEVVMPRDKGVTYQLHVTTDIPEEEWSAAFATDQEQFSVAKSAKILKSDEYILTITNLKEWAEDTKQVLTLTAKRFTMTIPVRQVNQSTSDWLKGNEEDQNLDGAGISATSLFFNGTGSEKSKIVVYGASQSFTVTKSDWMTVTQTAGKNEFIFKASLNLDANTRNVDVLLKLDDVVKHTIKVSQTALLLNDLRDDQNGILWRDRNEGAKSNVETDVDFTEYSQQILVASGDKACPVGWIVPSILDYKAMIAKFPSAISTMTTGGNEIEYIVMNNGLNKMYFQTKLTDLEAMKYWTSDGKFVHFSKAVTQTVADVVADNSDKGYLRCVRKFSVRERNIALNMVGDVAHVEFTTLFNGETFVDPSPINGFTVKRDGLNRLAISRSIVNLSDNSVTENITVSGSNQSNMQKLTITQSPVLPIATESNCVRIGNVEWDYKNLGATEGGNGFMYYSRIEDSAVSSIGTYAPTFIEGKLASVGTLFNFIEGSTVCSNRGDGWRVPTLQEWENLYNHMKVVKKDYGRDVSTITNNTTNYPTYLATDGASLMYIPVGLMGSSADDLHHLHSRFTRYWTASEGYGVVKYYMSFSRLLNEIATSRTYSQPGEVSFWNTSVSSLVDHRTDDKVFTHYVRCVRTVK